LSKKLNLVPVEVKVLSKGKEKTVSIPVPDYLSFIVKKRLEKYPFIKNAVFYPTCYVCGVNQTHIPNDIKVWLLNKTCKRCDGKIPYLLMHTTAILGIRSDCQYRWWLGEFMNIPEPPSIYLIEGAIVHAYEEYLVKLMRKREFRAKIKELSSSRTALYDYLITLFRERFDEIVKDVAEREILEYGAKGDVEQRYLQLKEEIFSGVLNDFAMVMTIRFRNNALFGGELMKLLTRREVEKTVFGTYEFSGVKILQKGRIDCLYEIDKGDRKIFVIRDSKLRRRIGLTPSGKITYDPSLQFGGYACALRQMYEKDVEVVGLMWLSRYYEVEPIPCDEEGFIETVLELCNFIRNGTVPRKAVPGHGLCSKEYCGYWGKVCDRGKKEVLI